MAVVQMVSSDSLDANLEDAARLLREASERGATLAVLPENFAFMGATDVDRVAQAEPFAFTADGALDADTADSPMQRFLSEQARALDLWLVGGTVPLRTNDPDRVASTSLVVDASGRLAARYDKIHLFDVGVPGSDEQYRESGSTVPGSDTVVVDTPAGRLGCTVCYDLRFPEQFRRMSAAGMDLVAVPAAFTAATGRAHWQTLLRARAIENLAVVAASAQGGHHAAGRETWGHSTIIDAWGNTLVELGTGAGVGVATVDFAQQDAVRQRFPALSHRRFQVQ
ncbi:MAG: carbon-nitrogen hydrolase family protein [Pseudomonadota bacterium]